jgi:hypothetical protein
MIAAAFLGVLAGFPGEDGLAQKFVGDWTCVRPASGLTFQWRVDDRLNGKFLVGEAEISGDLVAVDIWALDGGRLGERRQFARDGAVLVMNPVEQSASRLVLEGELRRDAVVHRMAETVEFGALDSFNAQWRVFSDDAQAWKIDSEETCRRSSAAPQTDARMR